MVTNALKSALLLLGWLSFVAVSRGQTNADRAFLLTFATSEQGGRILTTRDDIAERLSPFDRAARMQTARDVTEKEYLDFVGRNVLSWTDAEKAKVEVAFAGIQRKLRPRSLPFPKVIDVIKRTGRE